MERTKPTVSFGLPVRNGEKYVKAAIESVLAQTLTDWELVICDNASTDSTAKICESYAEIDARVRFFENDRDIGQIGNFNRVFDLSRGQYFRWIGYDDRLHPEYMRSVIELFRQDNNIVAVITDEEHYDDLGNRHLFHGNTLAEGAERDISRFHCMLWLYWKNKDYNIDPIYSIILSSAAAEIMPLRSLLDTHLVFGCALSLCGRIMHAPKVLVFRRLAWCEERSLKQRMQRYNPSDHRASESRFARKHHLRKALSDIVLEQQALHAVKKLVCILDINIFYLRGLLALTTRKKANWVPFGRLARRVVSRNRRISRVSVMGKGSEVSTGGRK